jgi:hypothetical protein
MIPLISQQILCHSLLIGWGFLQQKVHPKQVSAGDPRCHAIYMCFSSPLFYHLSDIVKLVLVVSGDLLVYPKNLTMASKLLLVMAMESDRGSKSRCYRL